MRIRLGGYDTLSLADWVEARLLVEGERRASLNRIVKWVEEIGIERTESEIVAELVVGEVRRRCSVIGGSYPFVEEDSSIKVELSNAAASYLFLLCMAISEPYRTHRRWTETDVFFDDIAAAALRNYLGPGTETVRFGYPPSGARPTDFRDAIKWLCALMELRAGAGLVTSDPNDGGVDVVAWKPLGAPSLGFLVLFCQTTVQIEWQKKGHDVVELVLMGWIDLGRPPLSALAIPFVVAEDTPKNDVLRREVTLILDRTRLCALIGSAKPPNETAIKEWTDREIERMRGGRS